MAPDSRRPNYLFLPDMAYSPAYQAYSENPVFADGKTLRSPVPGTVARGHLPVRYARTPEDALRAGEEMKNPLSATSRQALERGAKGYEIYCAPCHGSSGKGDGKVAQRGFPPPPSLFSEKALAMRDGQIFHIISYGQGNMPPYAAQMSQEDRWQVVLYLRSLQRSGKSQ
ncbi:MAG: cytochrome c [Acidobacteria bacterium]|nr:cytochrome c [Acidobacteriota bacterium]